MARRWKLAAAGLIGAAALTGGGVAHAGNYPPDEPAPTTVVASGIRSPEAPVAEPQALAATGSDTGTAMKVAAGAVVAGLGLVLVSRSRRHADA